MHRAPDTAASNADAPARVVTPSGHSSTRRGLTSELRRSEQEGAPERGSCPRPRRRFVRDISRSDPTVFSIDATRPISGSMEPKEKS